MSIALLDKDVILPFSFDKANIKGKIIRLSETSKQLLDRFTTGIKEVDKVFLDSLALSQLIFSNFKFEGTFKLQLSGYDGIIKAILCDSKKNGNIRGFMSLNENHKMQSKNPSFREIVGKDSAMIFHLLMKDAKQPYQAIVDLSGDDLSSCSENWFLKSEQLPTYIKIFSDVEEKTTSALFLQKIPNQYAKEEEKEEDKEIFNTFKILSDSITKQEMLNDNLEDILYKLYNEFDILIYEKKPIYYKCTCNDSVIKEVISTISKEEQESIRKENDGHIKISCSFCGKEYLF